MCKITDASTLAEKFENPCSNVYLFPGYDKYTLKFRTLLCRDNFFLLHKCGR
jgi:hypothetical protein